MCDVLDMHVVEVIQNEKPISHALEATIKDRQIRTALRDVLHAVLTVLPESLNTLLSVLNEDVAEHDVANRGPRHTPVFSANGCENCIADLCIGPTILKHAVLNDDVLCVLEL